MTVSVDHVLLYEGGHVVLGTQDAQAVLAVSSEDGQASQSVRIPPEDLIHLAYELVHRAKELGYTHRYLPSVHSLLRDMDPEDDF